MPCVIGCLAIAFPRLMIIIMVIVSDYIGRAYETTIWPLLGFFFMPLTTLAYAFGINAHGSITGWYLVLVVIAVLMDIGTLGGGSHEARSRR